MGSVRRAEAPVSDETLPNGKVMKSNTLSRAVFSLFLLVGASSSWAGQFGTAEDAKALLDRAAAEVKADESGALSKFNRVDGGYVDRDLYVFCFDAESGVVTAHPKLVGQNVKDITDKVGAGFGEEMFVNAKEGAISEIKYMWPRPGETEPVQKVSYYTRIGKEACGVGYYQTQ